MLLKIMVVGALLIGVMSSRAFDSGVPSRRLG